MNYRKNLYLNECKKLLKDFKEVTHINQINDNDRTKQLVTLRMLCAILLKKAGVPIKKGIEQILNLEHSTICHLINVKYPKIINKDNRFSKINQININTLKLIHYEDLIAYHNKFISDYDLQINTLKDKIYNNSTWMEKYTK